MNLTENDWVKKGVNLFVGVMATLGGIVVVDKVVGVYPGISSPLMSINIILSSFVLSALVFVFGCLAIIGGLWFLVFDEEVKQ